MKKIKVTCLRNITLYFMKAFEHLALSLFKEYHTVHLVRIWKKLHGLVNFNNLLTFTYLECDFLKPGPEVINFFHAQLN